MAKKRGNGEGSIYRRKDGRWVGQYTVYTAKGPKYRYLYGKTRRELDDALGLTEAALMHLQESRGGRNVQHGWSHYCASRCTAVWLPTRTLT